MLTRPNVTDAAIAACLRAAYGIDTARLAFLPLGLDPEAGAFRVEATDGRAFFLKLKRGLAQQPEAPATAGVRVPRFLRTAGVEAVIAPLATRTSEPWGLLGGYGGYAALLYPYVPGRDGFARGLTTGQWEELGASLGRIHALSVPPELAALLPRETFEPLPRWRRAVEALLAGEHERPGHPGPGYPGTDGARGDDEPARELAAFVREHHAEIGAMLARLVELGRLLQRRTSCRTSSGSTDERGRSPFVLCHADVHVGNVLIDDEERIHIVDWDEPRLAPRECDLMLVVGSAIGGFEEGSADEAAFFTGYGTVCGTGYGAGSDAGAGTIEIDPLALAYYRYERAVSDLGDFARQVCWMPDASDENRRAAVRGFQSVFWPGSTAEAALRADATLPSLG